MKIKRQQSLRRVIITNNIFQLKPGKVTLIIKCQQPLKRVIAKCDDNHHISFDTWESYIDLAQVGDSQVCVIPVPIGPPVKRMQILDRPET